MRTAHAALAAAVLALAACSSAPATTTRPPSPSPPTARTAPALGCAWYTPLAPPGQVVNVTATGPACRDRSVIGWLADDTDRPWTSESFIPGAFGQPVATLARNGSTVTVWATGPPAARLAGQIAAALRAAGWTAQPA
jgi:hypothetical protein